MAIKIDDIEVFLTLVGHGIMPEMAPAAFIALMTQLTFLTSCFFPYKIFQNVFLYITELS